MRILEIASTLLVASSLGLSCGLDPVHDAAVKELGEEDPAVPPGPYHRPGQPCTVCHGGRGPAGTKFLVAGTVFAARNETAPLAGVEVRVRDGNRGDACVLANCRGNFYLTEQAYPSGFSFPFKVSMRKEGERTMQSLVGREGSCSFCHRARATVESEPRLHFFDELPAKLEPLCDVATPVASTECR